jgi:hypothetical protein
MSLRVVGRSELSYLGASCGASGGSQHECKRHKQAESGEEIEGRCNSLSGSLRINDVAGASYDGEPDRAQDSSEPVSDFGKIRGCARKHQVQILAHREQGGKPARSTSSSDTSRWLMLLSLNDLTHCLQHLLDIRQLGWVFAEIAVANCPGAVNNEHGTDDCPLIAASIDARVQDTIGGGDLSGEVTQQWEG